MILNALVAVAVAASGTPGPTAPVLPAPSGPLPVGVDTLHLVDRSRTDPWLGSGPRELVVTFHFPSTPGGTRAAYTTTRAAQLVLADRGITDVDPALLAATGTHSHVGATPVPGRRPLVVLSPGFGVPGWTLTALAEDLASHGYVTATVDHPYESAATVFPDGRVTECLACDKLRPEDHRLVPPVRAADISFLLDSLPFWRYAPVVDPRRVGAVGHSMGGNAAVEVARVDRRVLAAVTLDGPFHTPATGLTRPLLMVGGPERVPGSTPMWDQAWEQARGPKAWRTVAGADHYSFTDLMSLGDQLLGPSPDVIGGDRSIEITRGLTRAFLEHRVAGRGHTEPAYPEVSSWG